jgi:hypothetical protein
MDWGFFFPDGILGILTLDGDRRADLIKKQNNE